MNGFISYSHKDEVMLHNLQKHLAQLTRDGIISAWTDEMIPAGGHLGDQINFALEKSGLFLALLSPDYIASNYCYEKEFQKALEMAGQGKIVIVPIIVEPCDWLNTPFKEFKALPKDGKAISEWHNLNTAFLDVITGIRNLLKNGGSGDKPLPKQASTIVSNYRVKKDFDSIQRLDFAEKSYHEIIETLKLYLTEINEIENVSSKIIKESKTSLESIIVNRNMINAEVNILVELTENHPNMRGIGFGNAKLQRYVVYKISNSRNDMHSGGFEIQSDEYTLFWMPTFMSSRMATAIDSKGIASFLWTEAIKKIGISV